MEPIQMAETESEPGLRPDEHVFVHRWRAERLRELGVPPAVADQFADDVDWRAVAALVERDCPPALAVDIVR